MAKAASLLPRGTAGKLLGTSLALGVAAGCAWAAGRALGEHVSRDEADNPRLINWDWARTIATRAAMNAGASLDAASRNRTQAEYTALVERSAGLVSAYTGVALPGPLTQVHVFDRVEWVDANLAQFRLMFAPLDASYTSAIARARKAAGVGIVGQAVLSGQMGILLGYLARRVLGQYDLSLLGREPVAAGRLYFVEPNIATLQQQFHLPEEELRAWIALHEVTHAFEFEAHPWVRSYMNEMLTSYLGSLSEDLFGDREDGILGVFARRIKDNFTESGHVLELVMSRDQRDLFRRMQALMALMEGYSNHVMNRVGAQQLKDHRMLKESFESRAKSRGPAEQLFIKLTGLDVKLEQYVLGERFCQEVVDARGIAFLNRVWEREEALPTLEEIQEPRRWIERQSVVAA